MQDETVAETVLVPLSGSVYKRALIDASDAALLIQYRWYYTPSGYAITNIGSASTSRAQALATAPTRQSVTVGMHRIIMGLAVGDPLEVDHINGDKLDYRRENLRVVTRAENDQNRPNGYGTSQYLGVSANQRPSGGWRANVRYGGRHRALGVYGTELEAARAAEAGRRKHQPGAIPRVDLEPTAPCQCIPCRRAAGIGSEAAADLVLSLGITQAEAARLCQCDSSSISRALKRRRESEAA